MKLCDNDADTAIVKAALAAAESDSVEVSIIKKYWSIIVMLFLYTGAGRRC